MVPFRLAQKTCASLSEKIPTSPKPRNQQHLRKQNEKGPLRRCAKNLAHLPLKICAGAQPPTAHGPRPTANEPPSPHENCKVKIENSLPIRVHLWSVPVVPSCRRGVAVQSDVSQNSCAPWETHKNLGRKSHVFRKIHEYLGQNSHFCTKIPAKTPPFSHPSCLGTLAFPSPRPAPSQFLAPKLAS